MRTTVSVYTLLLKPTVSVYILLLRLTASVGLHGVHKNNSFSLHFVIETDSLNEPLLVVFFEAGVGPEHVVLAHVWGVLAGGRRTAVSLRQHAHEVRAVATTQPCVLHAQLANCTCKLCYLCPAA